MYSEKLMMDDPVFSLEDKYFLSREEAFDRAMEKSVHFVRLCKKLNLDALEKQLLKKYINDEMRCFFCMSMCRSVCIDPLQ